VKLIAVALIAALTALGWHVFRRGLPHTSAGLPNVEPDEDEYGW